MKSPVEVGFNGRYKIKNVFKSAGMHLVFPTISAHSPKFQLPTLTALSRPGSCLIGCGGLEAASLALIGFSTAGFSDVDSSGLRAEVISEPHPSIPKETAVNSAASQPQQTFLISNMQIPLCKRVFPASHANSKTLVKITNGSLKVNGGRDTDLCLPFDSTHDLAHNQDETKTRRKT